MKTLSKLCPNKIIGAGPAIHPSSTPLIQCLAATLVLTITGNVLATVRYVDLNSTNATPPYTNWTTAATNIQDAVDAAVAGDEVVVTNGIYSPVSVNMPLMVRSVSGPQFTAIDGRRSRCASLSSNAVLTGFTLTNGASQNAGGAQGGTLNNCTLSGNSAFGSPSAAGHGGGAALCTLNNCTLNGNSASGPVAYGGGAYYCTLNNCTLSGNSTSSGAIGGGSGGGAYRCTLNNCTLTGNSADYGAGAVGGALKNCIVYSNNPDNFYESSLSNCWTADPLFVDLATGNLRLQSNSPCINAGNNAYAPAGPDLDGNPRIVGGTVDIGAYEYQSLSLLNFTVVSNQAGFNITGQSNQVVIVETSTDLANWSPLATDTLSGHPFPFSDPSPATLPRRFYRAQAQ